MPLQGISWPRVLIVTGTGTGVGKTHVAAALANEAIAEGLRVLVIKPVQTGLAMPSAQPGSAPSDAEQIAQLAQVPTQEWVRLPDPLAPNVAAERAGVTLPSVAEHAGRIIEATHTNDLVIVEGAGGLLVRLDGQEGTVASLAHAIDDQAGTGTTGVIVATAAGLGTLNATELTIEAIRARNLPLLGIVIGDWPATPDLAARTNLSQFEALTGAPLLALVPHGQARLHPLPGSIPPPEPATVPATEGAS